MSSVAPTFTVFTPTYNRSGTLHRVYESLVRQTFRDFEWLVVDDGSTDDTGQLIRQWSTQADFPIRYLWQENKGKHFAFNRGVHEAQGHLFLTLDSDDACVPEALERLNYHWLSIPEAERGRFTGVTCLCVDQDGVLVGDRFPREVTDSDSLEILYRYRVDGEKWGFQRRDVLLQNQLPELLPGEYVPEVLAWARIARKYRTRFVNEALRIYFVDRQSMVTGQPAGKFAAGRRLAHQLVLNEQLDYFRLRPLLFLRSAGQYVRLSLHARVGLRAQLRDVRTPGGKALCAAMIPAGTILYLFDSWR